MKQTAYSAPRPKPDRIKHSRTSLHLAGETTGMFRARTARGIIVEMERLVDIDKLPPNVRRFMATSSTR